MGFAIAKQVRQCALNAPQVGNSLARFFEPRGGNAPDTAAVRAIFKLQQRCNLIETEPQRLRAFDKADATHMPLAIAAIGARCPARLRYQSAPLIETYGLNANARSLCDVSDGEVCRLHTYSLTPY